MKYYIYENRIYIQAFNSYFKLNKYAYFQNNKSRFDTLSFFLDDDVYNKLGMELIKEHKNEFTFRLLGITNYLIIKGYKVSNSKMIEILI
jgi:hypothetical protein